MNPHPFFLYPFFSTHFMVLVSITLLLNIFLEHTLHILPSPRQRTQHAHTCRLLLFKKGLTFFSRKGRYTRETSYSIIAVMGNRIKCEGERQKHPRYIIVSRMFRFLSPTKLNRYEQAVYSVAHTIQPLCLAGVLQLLKRLLFLTLTQ